MTYFTSLQFYCLSFLFALICLNAISLTFEIPLSEFVKPYFPTLSALLGWNIYYSVLLPLSIPVTLLMIYTNWVGMKLFQYNR